MPSTAYGIFSFEQPRVSHLNMYVYMGTTPAVTETSSYFYGMGTPVLKTGYFFTHQRNNFDNSYIRVGDFKATMSMGIFGYPVTTTSRMGLIISGVMTDKIRHPDTGASQEFALFRSRSIGNVYITGVLFCSKIASTGNTTGGDDYKGDFVVRLSAGSVLYLPSTTGLDTWIITQVDRLSSLQNQWVKGYYLDCSQAVIDVSESPVQPVQVILDNSSQNVDGMVYRAVPQQGNSPVPVTDYVALN